MVKDGFLDLDSDRFNDISNDSFDRWSRSEETMLFRNKENGDIIDCPVSKRGNKKWAFNKKKQVMEIEEGFDGLSFDFPIHNVRDGVQRHTHLMLITLTVPTDLFSRSEAWRMFRHNDIIPRGSAMNTFKAFFTRELGSSYSTQTVKESNENGYPAPHILVMSDKPVRVVRWKGKNGKYRYIVQDRRLVDAVKNAWHKTIVRVLRAIGRSTADWRSTEKNPFIAHLDIRGVVGEKVGNKRVYRYMSQYLIVPLPEKGTKFYRTAVNTHKWQKLYNMRDVISKGFKDRLNLGRVNTRLDIVRNELKQINKQIPISEEKFREFGYFDIQNARLLHYLHQQRYEYSRELKCLLPPIQWEFIGYGG